MRGIAPAARRSLRVTAFRQLVLAIEQRHGVKRPTRPPRRVPVKPVRPRSRPATAPVMTRRHDDAPALEVDNKFEFGGLQDRQISRLLALENSPDVGRRLAKRIAEAVVDAAVIVGRRELPYVPGVHYTGATDPSGGSNDSFALSIDHVETDAAGVRRAVLDVLRETKPPFSPDVVVAEYAALLKSYGVTKVTGDKYAGQWPRERFAAHGIDYVTTDKSASDYYLELLPILNSGRAELLDHPRLLSQLTSLERSAARSGKENISHPPNAHDDVANCAAIALVSALVVPVYREAPIVDIFIGEVQNPVRDAFRSSY
jgi:hypothetical protein